MRGVDAICGTKHRQNVSDGVFLTFEMPLVLKLLKLCNFSQEGNVLHTSTYIPAVHFSAIAIGNVYTGMDKLVCTPASNSLIDDFRGACAFKGNGAVAGHVKGVDHDDVFDALLFREETLTRHYFK